MSGEGRKRWLVAAAVLAMAQTVSVTVEAQFFWDQQYQNNNRRTRPQSGGFFRNFFEPFNSRSREDDYYGPPQQQRQQRQHVEQPAESSRAPAPRKAESKVAPTTSIVVMGDEMSDWLAYGLEDVFSDAPEIGVVRKNKLYSGLVRYDSKGDLDWWHVARDTLVQEKADYIVMMLGIGDRQDLREKDLVKEAETRAKEQQVKDDADKKTGQKSAKSDDADETGDRAAQRKKAGSSAEFRSDDWAKVYSRRIDDTIAALKSKGVPVIWVGLPPIRGARSTADVAYLNDLYRARAERAGITYVDVWDGFVDEAGKYSNYGPDYEGQVRRLRLGDGVFLTKYGAIKLARYVEHELRRYMSNRTPVALPSGPVEPTPSGTKPTERPLTGPVVPLTGGAAPKDSDELLGGPGSSSIHGDATAAKVLAKGETTVAPAGRSDNFGWPNSGEAKPAAPVAPVAPVVTDSKEEAPAADRSKAAPADATSALASAPTDNKQQERKKGSAGKLTQQKPAKKPPEARTQNPPQDDAPRPPRPIEGSSSGGGFFGFGSWR